MSNLFYDPFTLINQLQKEINNTFDSSSKSLAQPVTNNTCDWSPSVDIKEEPEKWVLFADLPGVDPKEVEVTLHKNLLTITGHRHNYSKEEKPHYKKIERSSGLFVRQFTLPDVADSENITASAKDGVLTLSIPKGQTHTPKRIEISH